MKLPNRKDLRAMSIGEVRIFSNPKPHSVALVNSSVRDLELKFKTQQGWFIGAREEPMRVVLVERVA